MTEEIQPIKPGKSEQEFIKMRRDLRDEIIRIFHILPSVLREENDSSKEGTLCENREN